MSANSCFASSSAVLVSAKHSKIEKINIIDIRRLYLRMPVSKGAALINPGINPVINHSDSEIYQAFLKNIMRMTEKGYRRKLIKRMFRQGASKIKEISDKEQLINYLKSHPKYITIMSEKNAALSDDVIVIQKLW